MEASMHGQAMSDASKRNASPAGGPTQFHHEMPFGAQIDPLGGVAFRLWAPKSGRVDLHLRTAQGERAMRMTASDDGWHRLQVADARAGDRYHYRLDSGLAVPDPASRFQPDDIHGHSEIIDPAAFDWGPSELAWQGRPWHQSVIYELHVGSFGTNGDFAGVESRLEHLAEVGVTVIELMPLADFPGRWNWGYDGALLFAPDASYGRPDDLKRLVRAAHQRGLSVLLDVVYNHFGPEGNYLHCYAPGFFHPDRHTPWGAAIRFDGPDAHWVREFFIHNALYWLEEYRFDGLRLDAVDRIHDDSRPDILEELARRVHAGPGREREIHLILENDHNEARRYARDTNGRPRQFTAQWNDDLHHALHGLLTGETDGVYQDYESTAERSTTHLLARALTQGFAYQGEPSRFRGGRKRGSPSAHLPPTAVVNFLQNHDQAGNRAFGERLHHLIPPQALDAALTLVLLAPSPPLLFMGEEFDAESPFLFFCDFGPDLADSVREGRRREFARSAGFTDEASRARIPDPNDPDTFERSRLDWHGLQTAADGPHRGRLAHCRHLLSVRRRAIEPLIPAIESGGEFQVLGHGRLSARWTTRDQQNLNLLANLNAAPFTLPDGIALPGSAQLVLMHPGDQCDAAFKPTATQGSMSAWSVIWSIQKNAETCR
jgi:malto-oligosyltrehalose trehalohydrolase